MTCVLASILSAALAALLTAVAASPIAYAIGFHNGALAAGPEAEDEL